MICISVKRRTVSEDRDFVVNFQATHTAQDGRAMGAFNTQADYLEEEELTSCASKEILYASLLEHYERSCRSCFFYGAYVDDVKRVGI